MLCGYVAWGDVGDHASFGIANERVLQDLSQFALPERRVGVFLVQCSDTFFQSQKTLVDLRAFHLCLSVYLPACLSHTHRGREGRREIQTEQRETERQGQRETYETLLIQINCF